MDYTKSIPWGEFQTWVEREFEAVERAFGQRNIPRWDDLRFPANGIDPTGITNAATRATDLTKFPGSLIFQGATAPSVCAGVAQMPHAWKNGTTIRPHIHWTVDTASTAAVDWAFYYRMIGNVGDTAGGWVGPLTGTIEAGTTSVVGSHILSSFGDITMTGYTDSCMMCWYIQRNGNTDANNNNAFLLEFDIHYQTDIPGGSIVEYPTDSPFSPSPAAASLVITGRAPVVTKT